MNELFYIAAFLYHTLAGDAVLIGGDCLGGKRIYQDIAPQGTSFPCIIFNFQAGYDVIGNAGVRLFTRPLFQVRTVGRGSSATAAIENVGRVKATANRMDDLLKEIRRASFTLAGVRFSFNIWREREIRFTEQGATPNSFFVRYGGIYRCETFPSASP